MTSGGTNPGFLLGGVASGGVFAGGRLVEAYARGGIVNTPTVFPMARGYGLMGEAGPEAVMPLKRLGSGNLGVAASPAGVTINVINNATSFSTQEGTVKLSAGRVAGPAGLAMMRHDDAPRTPLSRLPLPQRNHHDGRLAVFSLPAEPADG